MQARLEAAGPATMARFRLFFLIAALFDGILGLLFLFFWGPIFDALGVTRPESSSYVTLAAAFIAVQGLGYFLVWRDMVRNVGIVVIGVAYKLAYVVLSAYYALAGELLHNIFAWFGAADVIFLIGFIWFLAVVREGGTYSRSPTRIKARE
jgi:hypothetical protein